MDTCEKQAYRSPVDIEMSKEETIKPSVSQKYYEMAMNVRSKNKKNVNKFVKEGLKKIKEAAKEGKTEIKYREYWSWGSCKDMDQDTAISVGQELKLMGFKVKLDFSDLSHAFYGIDISWDNSSDQEDK